MDTYGDMVTLLLTFFVLLFSFSTINEQKWRALVRAFSGSGGQIGIIDEGNGPGETNNIIVPTPPPTESPDPSGTSHIVDISPLYEDIYEYIKESGLSAKVQVSKTDLEIIIRFNDSVMFDSGKADLKPEALNILDDMSKVFNKYVNEIEMLRIEGHTDNVPIRTSKFRSNWDLSMARAGEVLRHLIDEKDFDQKKISAVGYGEYHPIATNETEEGRSKNRRVEFVITRVVNSDSN